MVLGTCCYGCGIKPKGKVSPPLELGGLPKVALTLLLVGLHQSGHLSPGETSEAPCPTVPPPVATSFIHLFVRESVHW